MPAVPVGAALGSARRSMPSASASDRASTPPASSPSAHTNTVSAPARRAATAWLKPLPPGPLAYPPARVSPGCGSRGVRHTWSTLNAPTTTTPAMRATSAAVGQHAGDGGGHQGHDRAAQHRAQAEPGQLRATVGRNAADAADLDGDRGEVGEAAQGVGGDQRALRCEAHALDVAPGDLPQLHV